MDPFRLDGPAIINVSGGRTSALMLRRILDAHGGALPGDAHAVFQNTGKERRADDRGDAELEAIAADLDALLARAQRYLDGGGSARRGDDVR